MSRNQLARIADIIQVQKFVDLQALQDTVGTENVEAGVFGDTIIRIFPVMKASNRSRSLLYEIHSLYADKNFLGDMFDDGDTEEEEHTDKLDIGQDSDLNNSASIEDRGEPVKEMRGRKGLRIHFPQLIDVVDSFLSSVGLLLMAEGER